MLKNYFNTAVVRQTHRFGSRLVITKPQTRTVKTSTVDWKPIKSTRSPNDQHNKEKTSLKSRIGKMVFLSLMIAMPIVSFQLGMWQYKRLAWKNKLVATCEERLIGEPMANQTGFFKTVFRNINLDKIKHSSLQEFREFTDDINSVIDEQFQYKKITLSGRFDHEHELFVGPRIKDGNKGYLLFTPFVLESGKGAADLDAAKYDGERVLVERGWISEDKVLPSNRSLAHLSVPQGVVQLECVLKVSRNLTATQWERENKDGRLWQVIDFPEMCKEASVPIPILFQQLFDLRDHKFAVEYEPDTPAFSSSSTKKPFSSWWSSSKTNNTTELAELEKSKKFKIKDLVQHVAPDGSEDEPQYTRHQFVKAGVPLGKIPKIEYKNDHLQYMVTWFGLSFLSSIFLVIALKKFRKPSVVTHDQLKKDKLKHASKYM